ncbi:Phytanoyl-dioxygenase [Colletotrichum asianum]
MSMPAPSKPLGALDFSQVTYGNKAQRFTAQTNLARLILAEKLQAFQEINALAKITFAEGKSTDPDPVWIDARSTPVKLLDSAPTEVGASAFELTWPPERFENLAEGRDDPQTAVFMSAVPTTGDYPLAIRFADLMTPNPTAPPKTAKELPLEELPKPTEDIDQVKRDLRRWGYGLLKNALTPEQVAILKKASEGSIACEAPAGTAMIFEGRIWHGTGQNTETSGERPCILSLFTHPAVRPKENALLALSWEAEDEVLSERHKSLAALRTGQAGVGGALGEAREGIIVKRPRSDFTTVGKLRAPHDDAEVAKMLSTGTHANNAQSAVREAGGLDK